ncbi:uncharacterized protein LOC111914944 [Lactuca sativa]|uniref:uncharacterized protein LOC111914944 n=1 Tax=Lactuca sativa TaxID=4236 RepID=UPI000CD8C25C|nr:uncharacterized protein LOC111914944 [Lactuca sativa]
MEFFYDLYAAIAETAADAASGGVAAIGVGTWRVFQYQDFDNTKPPTFDGFQDPIIAMRWLSNVDGCFFTCSCPADQKVKCTLNLLRSRAKDWWRLATSSYSTEQRVVVTWEQFYEMFRSRYVSLVERERLAQEYLDLRQGTENVTEITKMFMKRSMFSPEFATSEHAQMTRYFNMLKTGIRRFVSTQGYGSLLEMQEAARQHEIKIEL